MTVCADYLTLVNLSFDCFHGISATSEYRNVCHLVTQVIKLKYDDITLATIYAGMVTQIVNHEFGIYSNLFCVAYTCLLNIRCAIGTIMLSHVLILAVSTYDLPCATLTVTDCEVLDWLGWRTTLAANLRFHTIPTKRGALLNIIPHR